MEIMTAVELAEMLSVSKEFVYKNYLMFGGTKWGARLIRFERKTVEEIIRRQFNDAVSESEKVGLCLCGSGKETPRLRLPNEKGSSGSRARKEKEDKRDPNNLLESL